MSSLEQVRRAHFNAETNVKVLGVAMMIGAFAVIIMGLTEADGDALATTICVSVGGLLGLGGFWLRRLDVRGRSIYTVAAVLGILGFLILWFEQGSLPDDLWDMMLGPLLALGLVAWSNKATTVMSEHYRDVVIPATPQVKHEVSPKFVLAMSLLLLVIAASIFAAAIE